MHYDDDDKMLKL